MKISCIVGINALNFELSAIPHSITKLELSKETNKVGRKEYYLKAGVLLEITGDSMGGGFVDALYEHHITPKL